MTVSLWFDPVPCPVIPYAAGGIRQQNPVRLQTEPSAQKPNPFVVRESEAGLLRSAL